MEASDPGGLRRAAVGKQLGRNEPTALVERDAVAHREPDSEPGSLSDQGQGASFLDWALSWRTAGSRGWTPGKEGPHPTPSSLPGDGLRLPGTKSEWAGQEREQLSTPPTLLQDSWAQGEALARERHLPVSEEGEDIREGWRETGWRLLEALPLSVDHRGLLPHPHPVARPWWEGAGRWRGPHVLGHVGMPGPESWLAPPSNQSRLSVRSLTSQAQTRGQGWILQSRCPCPSG